VPLDPGIPRDDIVRAKAGAKLVSELARNSGQVPAHVKETVSEYAERLCKWREGLGLGCVGDDRTLLARHICQSLACSTSAVLGVTS
jgi:hypothetical protein